MSDKPDNLLDCLERTASALPDKVMFTDENDSITFGDFLKQAQSFGHILRERYNCEGEGVAVIVDKSIRTPLVYAALLYAGAFYLPVDVSQPQARIRQLLDIADTSLLLIAAPVQDTGVFGFGGGILTYEALDAQAGDAGLSGSAKDKTVAAKTAAADGEDPLCVIFTSGSTGAPKGVTLSHSAVLRYLTDFAAIIGLDEEDRLAGQSPPDYVAALRDLYLPFICGVSTCLVPKSLFSLPAALFEYLNEHRITTLFWVAPVLSYCAEFRVFDTVKLDSVRKVIFTGSVLPCAHLRYWQDNLGEALFINHYGPTEATATVSYYVVRHIVSADEELPIGVPLPAVSVELIGEDGCAVKIGETGEIYVSGGGLAIGYWRDPVLTEKSFPVLNTGSGNKRYFRTGDLGSLLPDGDLEFHGRKDSQIKLMGHRIELAEIDGTAMRLAGVNRAICVYVPGRRILVLFFTGTAEVRDMAKHLRKNLPDFMVPRRFCKIDDIPLLPGGKPDMQKLRALAEDA
jgi:amino acid adenylation domain-containing protein